MTMRRVSRNRRLTPEEAAKYREVREQVAGELPDLIARHHQRTAALDELIAVLQQLRAARKERGLSLAARSPPHRHNTATINNAGAQHFGGRVGSPAGRQGLTSATGESSSGTS